MLPCTGFNLETHADCIFVHGSCHLQSAHIFQPSATLPLTTVTAMSPRVLLHLRAAGGPRHLKDGDAQDRSGHLTCHCGVSVLRPFRYTEAAPMVDSRACCLLQHHLDLLACDACFFGLFSSFRQVESANAAWCMQHATCAA